MLSLALPGLASPQASSNLDDDQLPTSFTLSAAPHTAHAGSTADGGGVLGRHSNGSLLGIDSVVNWSSYFYQPGVIDQFGDPQFTWQYPMVGHAPFGQGNDADWQGETTCIGAPIVPRQCGFTQF